MPDGFFPPAGPLEDFEQKIKKSIDKDIEIMYIINVAKMRYEPLAQLAEHLTFNQGARGSNPRWLTNRKTR